jgi:phosphoglycolate phosphatase
MTPGALLLDLDGTLLDTPAAITTTLQNVLGPGVDPAAIRRTIGKPLDTSIAGLLGVSPDDTAVHDAVVQYRLRFARDVVPAAGDLILPGVVAGLETARRAGLRTAIVTSKVRSSAVALIEAAHLDGYLDRVVCHDMVARGKPQPDLAQYAAELLDIPIHHCVVVGDGVDDIRMALAAHARAVGVTTGVGTAWELWAAGADDVVNGFGDAVRAGARLLGLASVAP